MTDSIQLSTEKLQSQAINIMRFVLIVGVVSIHNVLWHPCEASLSSLAIHDNIIMNLQAICVPIFYIISGYFFFYHKDFSYEMYNNNLKKRIYTLFIPYLFWNSLMIGIAIALTILGKYNFQYPQSLTDLVALLGIGGNGCPFDAPLWYVRDLMIMCIFAPMVYVLCMWMDNASKIFIGVLLIILLFVIGRHMLSFFIVGAWFSIHKRTMMDWFKYRYIIYTFWIGTMAFRFFCQPPYSYEILTNIFQYICILTGYFSLLYSISSLIQKGKLKENTTLTESVFFILATHDVFINHIWQRFFNAIIQPTTILSQFAVYYGTLIMTIATTLILFIALKKTIPKAIKFACGR